jgi:hypothetical protein
MSKYCDLLISDRRSGKKNLRMFYIKGHYMPWELRFFSDDMNKYTTVRQWFESIDNIFTNEERDDMYIFSPESLDLGIKTRKARNSDGISEPAKLEIKWRKCTNLYLNILDGWIIGILEEWIKWGWNSGPIETNDDMIDFFSDLPAGPGITIAKDRSLRRYVSDNNNVRSTEWIKDKEDGVSCEITKIRVRNSSWWSIGLEGFGKNNDLCEFRYLLERILKNFPIRLEKNLSCGYPEWIKRNFAFPRT